jgi:hypothetical protein
MSGGVHTRRGRGTHEADAGFFSRASEGEDLVLAVAVGCLAGERLSLRFSIGC